MKWIWIILGLLVVGGIVVLWQGGTTPRMTLDTSPARDDRAPVAPVAPEPVAPAGSTTSAAVPAKPAISNTGETVSNPSKAASKPSTSSSASTDAGATPPPSKPTSSDATAKPSTGADPARPLPKIEHAKVVPSTLERQSDGSIVADGRFHITGEGTKASPYRVSWECLASAQETFAPRLSEYDLPERIAMLNGKIVRIDGYVSFPIMMQHSKELILMLNQWDGCCIGVPPTPYDGIEVKLSEPVTNTQRHAGFSFGSVTGIFKVEPYIQQNWLIGLYLMEDATYEPEGL